MDCSILLSEFLYSFVPSYFKLLGSIAIFALISNLFEMRVS